MDATPRQRTDIVELFAAEKRANNFLAVSAPMVRYSKLEFRRLVRKYGVKLCFTPMIIADSFIQSERARNSEFTTSHDDQPLIAQFAAKSAAETAAAAQLIYPYVDGVDINCGCPQSWAIAKGYGCALLRQPERICDILSTLRRTMPQCFSCSLKVRLIGGGGCCGASNSVAEDVSDNEALRSNVELARRLEHCGATFISVHGRTQWQKCSQPLNLSTMAEIKKSLRIPIVVNGNVRKRADACELQRQTNADGIMSARGLLANPTLFDAATTTDVAVEDATPLSCVQSWLNIAAAAGNNISFQCFHHHLAFMWSKRMQRSRRLQFNSFTRKEQIFDFFADLYDLQATAPAMQQQFLRFFATENTRCNNSHLATRNHEQQKRYQRTTDDFDLIKQCLNTNGKFYKQTLASEDHTVDEWQAGKAGEVNAAAENSYDLAESFLKL